MVTQNISVKPKMCFSQNEKHLVILRLRIRILIFMRLTTERDNLIRLYDCSIPYVCPLLEIIILRYFLQIWQRSLKFPNFVTSMLTLQIVLCLRDLQNISTLRQFVLICKAFQVLISQFSEKMNFTWRFLTVHFQFRTLV